MPGRSAIRLSSDVLKFLRAWVGEAARDPADDSTEKIAKKALRELSRDAKLADLFTSAELREIVVALECQLDAQWEEVRDSRPGRQRETAEREYRKLEALLHKITGDQT